MKIAILHPSFNCRGGAERKVLLIAQNLGKKFNIDIFTQEIIKDKTFYELLKGLKFRIIPYGKNISSKFFSLYKIAKRLKGYDLYNAHNYPAHISASIGKFLYKKPIVWFCNEPLLYIDGTIQRENPLTIFFLRILENLFIKNIDIVVANSKNTARGIKKAHNVDPVIIYSGINTKNYCPKKAKKLDQIFFISRITKEKNVDFLVDKLMPLVWKKSPNTKLIIGGKGNYFNTIKKKVSKIGAKNIIFTGRLNEKDKLNYYHQSKLIVFPPFNEPLGVIPLEAMACGVPVVAFNSGGCKETIAHNKTGFLANNEKEFADYVIKLLKDKKLREKFGKAGRKRVIDIFSVEQMVKKTENIYKKLLKKNAKK